MINKPDVRAGERSSQSSKPDVRDVMMITLLLSDKEMKNYVLPLSDIQLEVSGDTAYLSFPVNGDTLDLAIGQKLIRGCVMATTDPYILWAGDWCNLGTFRARTEFFEGTVVSVNPVQISFKREWIDKRYADNIIGSPDCYGRKMTAMFEMGYPEGNK